MASHIVDADAVCLHEVADKRTHGGLLRFGSRVLALADKVASANVAHAYALTVSACAVCANNLLWSALFYLAIKGNDVMIATALPASLPVPTVNIGNGKRLSLSSGGTVYDYFFYLSHASNILIVVLG